MARRGGQDRRLVGLHGRHRMVRNQTRDARRARPDGRRDRGPSAGADGLFAGQGAEPFAAPLNDGDKSAKLPDGQIASDLRKTVSSPKFMKIKNISLFQKWKI